MEKQNAKFKGLKLETVIVFTDKYQLASNMLNVRRTIADRYIFMTSLEMEIIPEAELLFDEIIPVNWTDSLEEVRTEIKKIIKNPELTRFISISDDVNFLVGILREEFKVPGPWKQQMMRFVNKFECKKH